jgi:SAM-dependent methyltransferase
MKPPNPEKMQAFTDKLVGDLGAAFSAALVVLGDRVGLFKAMADGKSVTAKELAERTGLHEPYLADWLSAMAAAGYVDFNDKSRAFKLNPEQAAALADDGGPAFLGGGFDIAQAMMLDEAKVADALRSGRGVGWHEHSPALFNGVERFLRPKYNKDLVSSWIASLKGVKDKLKAGAKVAEIGCGHGAATILMALAFPNSTFHGFDDHAPSVTRAKQRARDAGVGRRVAFEQADAREFPGENYDLVACFDCLHEMGDPVGVGAHVRERLAADGVWMIAAPFAHDDLADNLTPIGRIYGAISTMISTPAALSQEGAEVLGALAGEARIKKLAKAAGFSKFRRAAETPFNLVFEARV